MGRCGDRAAPDASLAREPLHVARTPTAAGCRHRSKARCPSAVVRYAAGLASVESAEAAAAPDLRHSFTTVARGLGSDTATTLIAAWIGHTRCGVMTSRYGDVPDALVRAAATNVARKIADLLSSGVGNRS